MGIFLTGNGLILAEHGIRGDGNLDRPHLADQMLTKSDDTLSVFVLLLQLFLGETYRYLWQSTCLRYYKK